MARASRAIKLRGTVNVLVTGSSELRSLNRRFRDKDQSTDVLSFPPGPCFVNGLAGDIAISADIAKQNARRLGHSAAQEIKVLALHGLLHLVGYDHESDQGVMAGKERQLRRSLGLPPGVIERSGQTEMLTKKPPAKAAGGGARSRRALHTCVLTGMLDVLYVSHRNNNVLLLQHRIVGRVHLQV